MIKQSHSNPNFSDNNTFKKISQRIYNRNRSCDDYNVVIKVGQEPDSRIFHAHSLILKVRSKYFNAAFGNSWAKEDEDGRMVFEKPNIEPTIFEVILRYIYSGILDITNLAVEQVLKLLVACDELCIQDLFDSLQSHIIIKHLKWIRKNLVIIYRTCFHHSSLTKLLHHFSDIVVKNPKLLFDSPEFFHFDESELISILQRKDLRSSLSEEKMWDYVLRWGVAQHPELPENPMSWKIQDFEKLKSTLAKCTSLIKFDDIGVKEFYQKVQPYAFALDADTYQRVHLKHLSKSQSVWKFKSEMIYNAIPQTIDSIILNDEQAKLIAGWISKDSFSTRMMRRFSETILRSGKRNGKGDETPANQTRLWGINECVDVETDNFSEVDCGSNRKSRVVNRRKRPMSAVYASTTKIGGISERERPMSAVFSSDFDYSFNSRQLPFFARPISTMKCSYEFRLLLRGTRDGFSPAIFHELCDNQGPTLCVFKLSGSGKILGGYNPLHWKSSNPRIYESSIDGFLFSLDFCTVINKSVHNYHRTDENNDYNGDGNSNSSDSKIDDHIDKKVESSSQDFKSLNSDISGSFDVEEYEVFKVVKVHDGN
ncbi:11001_t:CDS:2 [Acaulospora colombiana]|uniref:11001_t:CDS:1 n=1 Tax=Acaulospora colombiana TaxID=27376 RepID=A0ACA9MS49_9GLOM|nr:11001_t:CDS:2 [Acaulospora colombiana]